MRLQTKKFFFWNKRPFTNHFHFETFLNSSSLSNNRQDEYNQGSKPYQLLIAFQFMVGSAVNNEMDFKSSKSDDLDGNCPLKLQL